MLKAKQLLQAVNYEISATRKILREAREAAKVCLLARCMNDKSSSMAWRCQMGWTQRRSPSNNTHAHTQTTDRTEP